jgi:hypothetical protein
MMLGLVLTKVTYQELLYGNHFAYKYGHQPIHYPLVAMMITEEESLEIY